MYEVKFEKSSIKIKFNSIKVIISNIIRIHEIKIKNLLYHRKFVINN